MAANTNPIFGLVPVCKTAQISTANTNRDGTGTLGSVVTGAADGTRIDRIVIKASGTTTAGMVRIFVDTGGTIVLVAEIPVLAITPSGTIKTFEAELVRYDGLPWVVLASGQVLKAGTHNAEGFNITAHGSDYS